MILGLNLLYLIPGEVGGTETYARELTRALLAALGKEDQVLIFVSRAARAWQFPGAQTVVLDFDARQRFVRLAVEQLYLPTLASRYHLSALFSLGYSQPLFCPCPTIVTIHDLNWYYHPEDFTPFSRLVWQLLTTWSARRSQAIITDSEASRQSLHQVLGLPLAKISAILHAPPAIIRSTVPAPVKAPYLLSVGASYPHKNLPLLLAVFCDLTSSFPQLQLVITGAGKIQAQVQAYLAVNPALRGRIHALGYVPEAQLASLYQHATALVITSSYEGFGYPVVEAMSYGCPVVSSDAFALPEVVGKGGVVVPSGSQSAFREAITKLLSDPTLVQSWRQRGLARVRQLTWAKTASATLAVITRVIMQQSQSKL